MSAIEEFDQSTATMRLLITLWNEKYPMTRLTLFTKLREMNVGRTAAYKALKVCADSGLVVETAQKDRGKRVLLTELSHKGNATAFYLVQIQVVLSRWGTTEYGPARDRVSERGIMGDR